MSATPSNSPTEFDLTNVDNSHSGESHSEDSNEFSDIILDDSGSESDEKDVADITGYIEDCLANLNFDEVSTILHRLNAKYDSIEIVTNPRLKVATRGSAGHELPCLEEVVLEPGDHKMVSTGVYIEKMPHSVALQIWPKSGHATKGIDVLAGLVDSDYRKEIKVILINHGSSKYTIEAGKAVAQAVFTRIVHASNVTYVNDGIFDHAGFGSTNM